MRAQASSQPVLLLAAGSLALLGALATLPAAAADRDEPRKIAEAYLDALSGKGPSAAREHLLGGVPLAAREYTIPNWNIVEREPVRREKKQIEAVLARMRKLDAAGRKALNEVMSLSAPGATDIDRQRAKELLAHTKKEAAKLKKDFPVFAYVARVDKDVFWHPKNPWREIVKEISGKGSYSLELHLFRVEEREAGRPPRVWPLRVLRLTTSKGFDTGWKVLPASDWDPDY